VLGSEWLLFSLFRIAFFEKNEKEPKKKAKRTEKERNYGTTTAGRAHGKLKMKSEK